jgi:catechol 2,3-dioxygenase-like lactoylglutathione lyase family enzyme
MRILINRLSWLLIAGILLTVPSIGQRNEWRPVLVAVQVRDVTKSVSWYSSFLNFKVVSSKEFPDYGLKIAILELNNFRLELVENKKVLPKTEALQQLNIEDVTGFSKLTFSVPDIHGLYDELTRKQANFQIVLKESNVNPEELFFIVLDVDGNWLQFLGPK